MASARILVVDDDADVRRMLVDYLGTHDYEVAAAANGTEMRAALERQIPDVVLLDVGLPGEDGLSLARFLRERHPVGIIMVTAADGPSLGTAPAGKCTWMERRSAPAVIPSCFRCERT